MQISLSRFAPQGRWFCRLLLAILSLSTACGKSGGCGQCSGRARPLHSANSFACGGGHARSRAPAAFPVAGWRGLAVSLVDILQCLKSATAHRINKRLHHLGPVWEEESFDHVLRSDESLKEKCEYIRQNPVKAGLVRRPEDYPWLWDPESGTKHGG